MAGKSQLRSSVVRWNSREHWRIFAIPGGIEMSDNQTRHWRQMRRKADICRDILHNKYQPGETLRMHDQEVVEKVLAHHPRAAEKIGPGVQSIRVDWNKCYPDKKCFHVVRVDGSVVEFSYLKCLGFTKPDRKGCNG